MSIKTGDISGFGGGYEKCCQNMLTAGLKYLSDRASFDWTGYKQYKQVIGFILSENEDAKALEKIVTDAAGKEGCTGAMLQAVINHLRWISVHSYSNWVAQFKPEDVYDLDDPERMQLVIQVEGECA